MGLYRAIKHRKEKRQPWPYYKMVDSTCCNHGGCLSAMVIGPMAEEGIAQQ